MDVTSLASNIKLWSAGTKKITDSDSKDSLYFIYVIYPFLYLYLSKIIISVNKGSHYIMLFCVLYVMYYDVKL